jgi:hypothetical protein
MDHDRLLVVFGMSRRYTWLDWGAAVWILLGYINTFVALSMWIWLTQTHMVAGALMVVIAPALFGLLSLVPITLN